MSIYRSNRGGRSAVPLVVGDLIIFLAFAFFGRSEHNLDMDLMGTLMTAAPFMISWLIIGSFQGVYSPQVTRRPGAAAQRTIVAWLFAGPWGLLLRAFLLQRPIVISFATITLSFLLVVLTVWRVAYAWLRR